MIRFFFKLFHRQTLKYAFDFQSKPKGFEGTSQQFIDSDGRRYFSYDNDLNIPLLRLSALQETLMELNRAITTDEMTNFIAAMEQSLNDLLTPVKGKPSGIARIGHLVGEMKLRHESLLHEELLFKLAAIMYIREDEDVTAVDEEVLNQKVSQFRKDAAGGLHAFFMQDGLKKYIPFADMSPEEWESYLTNSQPRIEAINKLIADYTSVLPSSTKGKEI